MKRIVRSLALLVVCTTGVAASLPCVPADASATGPGHHVARGARHDAHGAHHDGEASAADGEALPPCHRVFGLRAPCACGCDAGTPQAAGSSVRLGFAVRAAPPDVHPRVLAAVPFAAIPAALPATPSFELDPVPI